MEVSGELSPGWHRNIITSCLCSTLALVTPGLDWVNLSRTAGDEDNWVDQSSAPNMAFRLDW